MKRLLVTGSARSGTGYVAEYLRRWVDPGNTGLVGHEDVYGLHRRTADGVVIVPEKLEQNPYPYWNGAQIEVSWLASPFLDRIAHDSGPPMMIHLVRDPIKTIASIYRRGFLHSANHYGSFAIQHLEGHGWMPMFDPLERACHYWCEWNMSVMLSKKPVAVWRVETLSHADLASALNHCQIPYQPMAAPRKGINSGGNGAHDPARVPRSLADIPVRFQEQVSAVGSLFGYEVK